MPLSTLLRQTGLTSGAAWVLAEGTAATRARRETEEHARARETVEEKLKREAEERAIWEELAKKTEVEKTELIARREAPPARADQTYPSLEIVGPLRAFAEAQQYFGFRGNSGPTADAAGTPPTTQFTSLSRFTPPPARLRRRQWAPLLDIPPAIPQINTQLVHKYRV